MMQSQSHHLKELKTQLSELYEITSIDNANDILSSIKKQHFDFVIIENNVTDEALDLVKKIRNYSNIIYIFIYSRVSNDLIIDSINLYKAGADDVSSSTIDPKLVKAKITSILRRVEIVSSNYFSNVVKYGDLIVDRDTNVIYLHNKIVETTKTEYKVLRYLMKANGKIVKREELQTYVWGSVNNNSKTMDVTVSSLKKKIGSERLMTVRGIGYMLALKI